MGHKIQIVRINLEDHKVTKRSYIMSSRLSPEAYARDVVMPRFGDDPREFKILPPTVDESWVEDEVNGAIRPTKEDKILRLSNGKFLYAITQRQTKRLQRPAIPGLPAERFKADRFIGNVIRTFYEVTGETDALEETARSKTEVMEVSHTFNDTAVPFAITATKVKGENDFTITVEIHECVFPETELLDLADGLGRMERTVKKLWRVYKHFHGEVAVNHGF